MTGRVACRLARALLAACLLPLAACTIVEENAGSDRFRSDDARALIWEPGHTTQLEVARALGPPDSFRRSGSDLVFVYRFRREVQRGVLVRFYLNLFQLARAEQEDTTLIAAFDADGRLLYHALEESVPEG